MSAYSMGVIGGADGPTAIFITGPNWTRMIVGILIFAALAAGVILLKKFKR